MNLRSQNLTKDYISSYDRDIIGGLPIRIKHVGILALNFAFILLIGLLTISLASEDVSSLVKAITPGTVLIQTYGTNGEDLKQGSGFFINDDGDIVTCAHVMKGYTSGDVVTSDQKKYKIKGVKSADLINDLAIVSTYVKAESSQNYGIPKPNMIYDPVSMTLRPVAKNSFISLKLSTTIPEVGQEIIVIGTPLGLENTVSTGIISAIRDNKIQITAPISPGSSGSPVLNMDGGSNWNCCISNAQWTKFELCRSNKSDPEHFSKR